MNTKAGEHNPKKDSCAVVVTFNPEVGPLLKLLSQLNREIDFLVVDNGSADASRLDSSIRVYQHCLDYIRLPENEGLAAALNVGIERVRGQGYQFVFLFDQDSSTCDMYCQRMLAAYREASQVAPRPVAAVGPRIINPHTRRQTPFKLFNRVLLRTDRGFYGSKKNYRADFLVTSGTLLPVACLEDIGLMKASYFIDNVDLEWCFRARSRGYELVGTDQALLYHTIGERSDHPLVRRGVMAQHNPARSYYSSRNRVHLYRTDYAPLGWKIRDMVRFLLKSAWLVLMTPERRLYWQNISAGVRDARILS